MTSLAAGTALDRIGGRHLGGGNRFANKADQRAGELVIGLAGDSTSDESAEWFSRGLDMWLAERPWVSCRYNIWDDASGSYTASTKQTTNVAPVTAWSDGFNRTASDLIGATPDSAPYWAGSPVWSGAANAPGAFSLNGTKAVATGTAVGLQQANHGVTGDTTVTASGVTIDTSTARGHLHVYPKYVNATACLYAYVIVASDGTASAGIWRVANGVSGQIGSTFNSVIPQNASTTFDIVVTVTGLTVTAVVNGHTITTTLTGRDAQAIAPSSIAALEVTTSAMAGTTVDGFTVSAQPGMQNLRVYNGSKAGSRLDYQIQRLKAMFPETVDLLMVSSNHNYASDDERTYQTKVQQFVQSYRNTQPDSGITLCSQNPEFPPATSYYHNRRNTTLRHLARQHGYDYLAAAEAFLSLADQGRSLTRTDGVHPLGSVEVADPNNGSYLWATVFRNYLADLSTLSASAAAERGHQWSPPDVGWKAWTMDPASCSTQSNWSSGVVQVWAMIARRPMTISNIMLNVAVVGATLTAGQSLVGIYQNGTRLGVSADQSGAFVSTGAKVIPLTSQVVVAPGVFYVAVLCVGTTTPQVHAGGSAAVMNSGSLIRFGTANTGQTSLPATLGTITAVARGFWAAVS